ncbi:aldehyde dehydrogenase family protein [Elizabethkingia sp. JS20170427COW]|uniref:L-piperidine-6-carboxylate dehydrogenase n=1 Tax=Elizabethkingia sp. JS20170427COW TaxID=2583851 RepID=UPI001110D1B4|nr:aldehyde dehydrogenase family protein [Elizabethkingia sp. JS20170427COW]QCX54096.1 aldehyde dehydrogenase family protein [Elizabethkingia sp. JS20170427COW]
MAKINISNTLALLGIEQHNFGTSIGNHFFASGENISSISPVDGHKIATVQLSNSEDYNTVIQSAQQAFLEYRNLPAPQRGEMLRQFSHKLRTKKQALGELVSYEMGKSLQEGLGEVQEMIDICEFALGLSRQLYGSTMHSERPEHRMYEQYHPLGVVAIISAFNFPVSVWSWNAALALVCGNSIIWKPSEKVPLCAIACQKLLQEVFQENNLPLGISNLVIGKADLGKIITEDHRIALVSFTGSSQVGREVGITVASRFGKSILELGGNNAIIISKHANLSLATIAAVFGAVGTAGQRCTTTRRLIIHEEVYDEMKQRLTKAYQQIKIGNPLDEHNQMGPLIDRTAVVNYLESIENCKAEGGKFIVEGGVLSGEEYASGCYVKPCIAEVENHFPTVQKETFAPILYLIKYKTLEEAIALQNDVKQGLSSAIMTENLQEAEQFLSSRGSDCGIANVNIGTSGAEIGGAFGGEKETGGGRESGSDAWKYYMRRQTNTINFGNKLPLAQGIKFDI